MREASCIKLLFKSDKKKLSFRRVESQKVCSHPERSVEICYRAFCRRVILEWNSDGGKERKSCVSSAYKW